MRSVSSDDDESIESQSSIIFRRLFVSRFVYDPAALDHLDDERAFVDRAEYGSSARQKPAHFFDRKPSRVGLAEQAFEGVANIVSVDRKIGFAS